MVVASISFLSELEEGEYKGYLVNQGYPSKLVDDQFRKASSVPSSDLLRTRARSKRKLFHLRPHSIQIYLM